MVTAVQLTWPGLLLLLHVLAFSVTVRSQGMSCGEYGIGEVSECADDFASLFHINRVEGNTDIVLQTRNRRQVLIPGINFTCNGTLTKWIFGAEWEGNTYGYTELQIWRKTSTTDNVYTKVGATTIMVTENSSEVYEYTVDPPLAFLEGDVLGYFQPDRDESQIVVYVERSDDVTVNTHRIDVDFNDVVPPTESFDIQSDTRNETRHPLIAVETDPPDCGCGFMSMERVIALLPPVGLRRIFSDKQLIFPDITFTCSGEVVKWIMGGKWNNDRNSYPELQIWRPSGGTTYSKEQSTTIMPMSEEDDRVYEFPVEPPLPFQPGDILGVRQPDKDDSRLQVDYEDGGDSVYYQKDIDDSQEFDITDGDVMTDLPLVTVEIVEYPASSSPVVTATESPVSSSADQSVTSSTTATTSATESAQGTSSTPSQTPSPPSSEPSPSLLRTADTETFTVTIAASPQPTLGINTSSHTLPVVSYISAGVSGAVVVVLVAAAVTVISVSVCLRKRKNKHVNTTDNVAYHCSNSSGQETMKLNETYAEISGPSITTSTNDAYGITGGARDVTTSQNEAYAVTDGACQSSGSGMKMKTNEAYADMSSAMNEDAYTYVTHRNVSHCTTAVLTATNAAYNAHTSTDEVYDYPNSTTAGNDIGTSSNEAYGVTTDTLVTSPNQACGAVMYQNEDTEYI